MPQYNTGSSLNGGGNSIPFAYSSSGVRGQGLYPVGVFGSPPSGRAIKKVYWGPYPSSTGSVTYSQLQIYLKQANISSLSTTYETGMTQVFSATSYYLSYTAGYWYGFTLPTPFPYNPNLPLIWEVRSLHQSFVNFYNNVVSPTPSGAYRNYSSSYSATTASGAGAYMISFGFDLVQLSTGPNDAGVEEITEPKLSCVGTYPVKVKIKNFGKNKIDSVRVHWAVNAVPQTTYMHRQVMDTNGTASNTATVTLGNITFTANTPYSVVAWTEMPNNKVDTVYSNDTSDANFTGRAYPVVKLGNDTSRCPGDTIFLNSGTGNDSVKWTPTATSQVLKVFTPGTYSVKAWRYGCMGGDTIVIGTFPAAPAFNLGPDTTICDGESFLLNPPTGTGFTYLWQDNTTNSVYLVDTSGTYTVQVSTVNSCKSSDKIIVKLFADPTVSIKVSPSNTLCYGKPFNFQATPKTDGSILYQWKVNGLNSGPTTTNPVYAPTLTWGDTVSADLITDICAIAPYPVPSNEIVMYINPQPKLINALTADTVIENTKKSYAIGIVAGNSYLWRASGGSILGDSTVNAVQVQWGGPSSNAFVSLQETDATNCTYLNVLPVKIISIIGIDEKSQVGIGDAYPNPADNTVNIPVYITNPSDLSVSLHDISGKKVMDIFSGRMSSTTTLTFATSDLRDGAYFCRFITSDGVESVRKIMISH